MSRVTELSPGYIITSCTHFRPVAIPIPSHSEYVMEEESTLVWLDKVGTEGHHGTCPTCGAEYFSRFNRP